MTSTDPVPFPDNVCDNAALLARIARLETDLRASEEHLRQLSDLAAGSPADAALRQHAREMAALYEVSLEINSESDLTTLLRLIVERATGLLGARMGGLYLMQPDNQSLELVVSCNLPQDYVGTVLKLGEGLSGRVAQTGRPMMISDYQAWEGRAAVFAGEPFRRALGVPLKVRDKVIGVINISDDQHPGSFTEDEVRLAGLFADQAALSVEKARLLDTVRRDLGERHRAEQVQTALFRISEAAHAASDVAELCAAIHQIVNELMPARNFGIALQDIVTDTLYFPYYQDEGYPSGAPAPRRRGRGLLEYVMRTGEPLLGTTADIRSLAQREGVNPFGSPSAYWLGVPLKTQQRTIGVVVVQTYRAGERLTEVHRQILTFVSSQIAMVLQRKRAEQAQVSIYRIASAALLANNLEELYMAIHRIVGELMPARNFFIALYDSVEDAVDFAYFVDEMEQEPPERQRRHGHGLTEYVLQRGEPWLGTQAMIEELVARGEVRDVGPLAVDWLGVPLKVDGQPIGVIAVQTYSEAERLSEEDKDLLLFVSAQVAMAIQRRRAEDALRDSEQRYRTLFDAAQRQAQELALLDQARTALLRELDLKVMFDQVVPTVAATFGYALVSLYLRSGEGLALQRYAGQYQPRPVIHFDEGIIGRTARLGQPMLVSDVTRDPDFIAGAAGVVSEIAVPLFDGEQVVGVLNIESMHGMLLSDSDLRMMVALSEHINLAISRVKLFEQVRENEARLRAIISNVPLVLFMLDSQGKFLFSDGRDLASLGLQPGQVVGLSVFDVYRNAPEVLTAAQRALRGEAFSILVRVSSRVFEVWYSPLWNAAHELEGVLGVAVDVTEREYTAQALRDSEERYRLMFDSNPYPMWAYDLETLRFLTVNDAAVKHYGYSREEFLNMTIADIRPAEDVPGLLENIGRVTGGLDEAGIWRHCKKDGTLIDVEITSHTLVLDGRPAEVVLATDVTERRRTEEALRRAQKMESLGILAGGIAHDFNNLLVGMLGQTSLALKHLDIHTPARVPVEKAITAARRAADLTRQLLAYSGRGQFEQRSLQLNRLIQDNLHLFEVAVPKQVKLQSELTESLPSLIGDAGQLQQVVMNLIINGAEALGEQEGFVVVRTRTHWLAPDEAATWQIDQEPPAPGEYVLLEVEDNGCGMAPETLAKIFDPFFTTKFTGRGLGLAAVLGIVRGHRGGLRVSSELHKGTRFELIFPGTAALPGEPVTPEFFQETVMIPALILVIDDEEPVREAVTDILDIEGLRVINAPDGWTGIELYRERQAEIDLVILDLSMPGLSGDATLTQLRQINPQVRVLLASGYSQTEVAERFAGQPAVSFMQKPFDLEQLVHEVKRQLAV
jgi:PAS domain S-box-containing protein